MIVKLFARSRMTACLAAVAALLSSCGQTAEPGGHTLSTAGVQILHYFTWSDYVGPEILAEFERREQAKVIVDVFSSNEELLAKLQAERRVTTSLFHRISWLPL